MVYEQSVTIEFKSYGDKPITLTVDTYNAFGYYPHEWDELSDDDQLDQVMGMCEDFTFETEQYYPFEL